MTFPRTNLVPALGVFVGRRDELDDIGARLEAGERLITITGTGGIGKTRLARQLGALHAARFAGAGGVWLCDVTEARDVAGLCNRVATVLEVPPGGGGGVATDVARLGRALSGRGESMLMLDNFEQLLPDGASVLETWLASAPDARFVVTSRERLRIDGEVVIHLGPLSLPALHADATALESAEAVQLLLDRVRRLRSDFRLAPADVPRVARIVEQLDGIPLAIELAAARLAFLGAQTLLERLHERFRVLAEVRGRKQTTLLNTLEWSWQLLGPVERDALAQSSVFRGGFDLAAAEDVIDVSIHGGAPPVLDVLQSLHDKSLVRTDDLAPDTPGGRFDLFLSIREFAAEKLEESGEADGARQRHASHYATIAWRRAAEVLGPAGVDARAWLAREKDNLRAVVERGPRELAARAAVALSAVYSTQGPVHEYLALLDRVPAGEVGDLLVRTELLIARANAQRQLGRLEAAAADAGRALEVARERADERGAGRALFALASVELAQGRATVACETYERALEASRRAPDPAYEAMTLSSLGAALAANGDIDAARKRQEEAIALHARVGNLREEGMVSAFLGNLCIDEGRTDEARVHFAHAMAIHEQVGDRFGQAFTTANLGMLRHRRGELAPARAEYERALALFNEIGAQRYVGAYSGYLGIVERELGNRDAARARLVAACDVLAEADDQRFRAFFAAMLASLEAELGAGQAAERRLAGAEQAIAATRDPFLTRAVALQRLPFDLVSADEAERTGDARRAAVVRAAARDRLQALRAPDESGRSPIDRSFDLLLSFRAVAGLLDDEQVPGSTPATDDSRAEWPKGALVVDDEGKWFRTPDGERIDLARRDALRRILHALIAQRTSTTGTALSREALIAAGWPGERLLAAAAANRVRVAVATLRRLGLHDVIVTSPEGYTLSPHVPVVVAG